MNRILTAAALVAMAALSAAPALAATAATTTAKPAVAAKPVAKVAAAAPATVTLTFKLVDANHDGKISYTELKKYFPKLTKADFAKYDTDKSGFLNKAEFAAFAAAMAPAKPTK